MILAGVTIATLTGDNGLLTKTADSKNENIIGTEKEKIGLGYNEYKIKKYTDTNPELTVEGATVEKNTNGGWTIKFTEHEYTLSEDGKTITGPQSINNLKTTFTFSIQGTPYTAEEGMNWEQWVASDYNTVGYIYDEGFNAVFDSEGNHYIIDVTGDDLIIENEEYSFVSGHSG